jgi:CheY-like chemotaxis protein
VFTKIEAEHPDLVILDLWMPGMNGEQIAEKLKGDPITNALPIIVISASRDGRQIAERCGANDFIEKPFDIATLTGRVKEYI